MLHPVGGVGYNPGIADVPTRVRRAAERLNAPPTGWKDLVCQKPDTWRRWVDGLDTLEADADPVRPGE